MRAAAELVGLHPLELGSYDTDVKLELLRKFKPRAIVGSALYLRRLIEAGGEQKPNFDTCFIAGEAYPESWITFMTNRGVKAFEWYGITMLGQSLLVVSVD